MSCIFEDKGPGRRGGGNRRKNGFFSVIDTEQSSILTRTPAGTK